MTDFRRLKSEHDQAKMQRVQRENRKLRAENQRLRLELSLLRPLRTRPDDRALVKHENEQE